MTSPMSANMSDGISSTGAMTTVSSIITLGPKLLVTDGERVIANWIIFTALLMFISGFGVISNIINIICFVRQGLNDPVNVSLLGLAISDLGSLLTSFITSISCSSALQMLKLPVEMLDVVYISLGLPHIACAGVTCWITCLIALERCLCITMPMKVKNIITPQRVKKVIICLFIIFAFSISPMYFVSELAWVFSPERNRTVFRLVYAENKAMVEQISYAIANAFLPFTAYVTIIVCTVTLVVNLRNKAKWRKTCTATVSTDNTVKRDQRVSQMVIMISTIFIICFTPMCVLFLCMVTIPALAFDGPNQNLLYIIGGISMVLESANSSANIFIYYRMSTRYRSIFRALFSLQTVDTEHRRSVRDK